MNSINHNKIGLLLVLSVFSFLGIAQTDLYVSDNSNVSVFVDGTGLDDQSLNTNNAALFVTNGIELAGTNSVIYLRNGAQLLQSNDGSYNTGQGRLSIHQIGTVDNFSYHFWGSPVGNVVSATNLNNPFIPENNIYYQTSTAAPFINSSAANFTTGYDGSTEVLPATPLIISEFWIYKFLPGTVYADWDFVGQGGDVDTGYGFTMKGTSGSGSQLYDFRGKPNTGSVSVNVNATEFTLAGNPYPSALDAREFFHQDGLNQLALDHPSSPGNGRLLFWEDGGTGSHFLTSYVGGYATYIIDNAGVVTITAAPTATYNGDGTATGITLPPGDTMNNTPGVDAPGRYLPVGQGFMVEGATGSPIVFSNSYRAYWKESSGNSIFFDSEEPVDNINLRNVEDTDPNWLPDGYMRFRIVVDITFNDQYFSRELAVNMANYATEGYDFGMEAKHPDVYPSDAHWTFEDTPFSILAVPFSIDRKIPLTVVAGEQQSVRFRSYKLRNFPESLPLYVHDLETDVYVNLRENDYEINLEAGTYTDRFEIVFERETLGLDEETLSDLLVFQDNVNAALTIKNPNALNITQVTLYDVAGKQLINVQNMDLAERHEFSTRTLSDGVYLATVVIDNITTLHKKVVIKN